MALALPAASVPPISVQTTSQPQSRPVDAGHPARGEDHRRDRRDEQQLDDPRLRQRDVGADRVAGRPAGSRLDGRFAQARVGSPVRADRGRPGRVVARDGQPDQHREDDRAEGQVERLRPAGQARSGPAARRRRPGSRTGRPPRAPAGRWSGRSRWVRHATTRERHDHEPDDGGHPAMEDVRRGGLGERRDERPAHQRPVREDQRRVGRGHLRAEQQQRERRQRP